ncbi:exodeoxyribonuclease V subunit gamma [soil metagenome]
MSGFQLLSGNRLDRLAGELARRVARPASVDTLWPETVLIPQPTLRRWLQVELAQRLGVAANLEFLTPSQWVWRMLHARWPDLPPQSPWDPDRLRWRLYAQLSERTLPEAVAAHLARTRGEPAVARWRLAEALAGAFDKYQAYRRDWLEDWDAGEAPDDWQAQLWRGLHDVRSPPRANLIGRWLREFGAGGASPPGLRLRLSAFGTIHVSPDVLRMLAVAGRHCDLAFYRPSPCAEYWGDVESLRTVLRRDGAQGLPAALAAAQHDNPLLQAWGTAGREFVAQLFAYDLVQPDREDEHFISPPRDSLLHAIQADVLDRAAPTVLAGLQESDLSLQVHACHSRLREVEVLHDRLRGLLDDDPSLQPQHIAVLAPNIGDYLPLVRAVFGALAPGDARFIPFTLSDRPQAQSHPLLRLFLSLLALPQARRTVTEVRHLLAVPAVMSALALSEADLQRLDAWMDGAGIRWGEDEAMREALGLGRWREHSFAFGLDRLLLGYATGDDADLDGIAPYPEIEGADAECLDRLLSLLARLSALTEWMRMPHVAQDWRQRLVREFLALLPAQPVDDAEPQARRAVLEALDTFASQAEGAGALPVEVVAAALQDALAAPSPHQPFLGGGVTFAGMVPLRTVPFRVIALLGMDADAFPRREPAGDINRLVNTASGHSRLLGDRSVREDDRFLFLQLLSAARDVFYLSYGGFDTRDGRVREPSSLVSQLLDTAQHYLPDGATGDARSRLVIEHPLQPFSPLAFGQGDSRRFSYRREWRQPRDAGRRSLSPFVVSALGATKDHGDAGRPPLDLAALQHFLRNPARAFLRHRLGLQLPRMDAGDPDREPLGDNKLLQHQRMTLLLEGDRDATALHARGLLPPGREGVERAEDARARAAPLRDALQAWLGGDDGEGMRIEGELALAGAPVQVRVGGVHRVGDELRHARALAGGLKGKHWLPALLDHLGLAALHGTAARGCVLFHGKQKEEGDLGVESRELPVLDAATAQAWLQALVELWEQGQRRPLPFAPDAAWAWREAIDLKPDARDAAWNGMQAVFEDRNGFGDGFDPWIQLAFRPEGMLPHPGHARAMEFLELAREVFCGPQGGAP